jgi:hypothetical protein
MPLKINGHAIPWTGVTTVCIAIFWLAGLSFQVKANGDEIREQADTKERLAAIEEIEEATKEDVKEVKEEQKEQRKILVQILQKVSE